MECVRVSAVSVNLASYDYSPVEKTITAFAIFRGCNEESSEAEQMLAALMMLHDPPFEVE